MTYPNYWNRSSTRVVDFHLQNQMYYYQSFHYHFFASYITISFFKISVWPGYGKGTFYPPLFALSVHALFPYFLSHFSLSIQRIFFFKSWNLNRSRNNLIKLNIFCRFISEIEVVCRQWLADGPKKMLLCLDQKAVLLSTIILKTINMLAR